jgi:TatD DNase family protein
MLIDTHCHLNFGAFKDDAKEVAKISLEKNVWLINVGSQGTTSERAVEFTKEFDEGVYAAVGLHPSHLFEMAVSEEEIEFESRAESFDYDFYKKLAANDKVVAIGETGLDYNYIPEHEQLNGVKEKQVGVFRQHLDLATELNLPVIIHARETYDEIAEIVSVYINEGKLQKRGVMHCYLGNWDQAQKFLEMGFLISFTGVITFPAKKTQLRQHADLMEVLNSIPLEKIMVETDAPFLSPVPHRGERNLPFYVEEVAKKIAEIKKISLNEVSRATTENAKRFFNIK